MADQKISQLTTIVTVDNATDLFPIVDTSVGETKKITPTALKTALALNNVDNTTDALKPVSTATQTALNAKQDTLVSATNIKTVNSTSLLGSGNIVIGGGSPSGVAGAIQFSDGTAFASDATNLFFDNTNNRLGVGINLPTSTVQIKGVGATSTTTSLLVQDSTGTDTLSLKDNGALTVKLVVNSNGFSANSTGYLQIASRLNIKSPSDGNVTLFNDAETSFGRLNLGGTTSSFPAIKRALNNIEVKNADDTYGGGLSVGAALNTSAILQADSTTKGFLPPRMTTTQRDAIVTPATGLVIYNTTLGTTDTYDGAAWQRLGKQTFIKGSGSTSSTTSLLVQNSAGTAALTVKDDLSITTGGQITAGNTFNANYINMQSSGIYNGEYFSLSGTGGRMSAAGIVTGASTINASSILQADSTTQGFLPPRMTSVQKNAIATPAAGLMVYDTTLGKLCVRTASAWETITSL